MSEFNRKCGNVLTDGATGAAAGGSIGAAIGALGGPVTSGFGATVGGAIGSLAGMFSDQQVRIVVELSVRKEGEPMSCKCRICPMRLLCMISDSKLCKQEDYDRSCEID